MKFSFPKGARLLSKGDFRSVKAKSQRFVGKHLCADIRLLKGNAPTRLGITASGHYGSSCERNRFKRLVREAFRLSRPHLPSLELHIIPRQKAKGAQLEDITAEFSSFLAHVHPQR